MDGIITGAIGGFLDGMARNVWTGTLELLRNVLGLVGTLGRVDPTPGAGAISTTLWSSMLQLAAVIAVILFFAQLAMAVLNPRRHMLTAALGPVQYGIATVLTVTMVVALLGAADGLTSLILHGGADVTNAAATMDRLGLTDDNNAVKAPVLAVLGIVAVLPLSIGYGIMLLFRSASILVIFATIPILSAGLVNLATKHWFWRGLRWMLALIFIQPTFALCFTIGSGVISAAGRGQGDIPTGAGTGLVQNAPAQGSGIVTLLLGFGILFVALFAPMALFRLFAFVEPGTQPHQTMMSAFGSAAAGFKQAGAGIATADVGSVFSSATGGRFSGGGAAGAGGGSPDGTSPSGGGAGGNDDKKQLAATAALAAATGGASAAAGAGGATAGAGGAAASGGASTAGAQSVPALAGQGTGAGSGGEQAQDAAEQGELAGAGAAASSPGQLAGASSGAASGGASGGSSGGGSSSGGSGGGSSGSYPSGSLAGVASAAASSVGGAVGSWGGGAVGAAGSAARSVGGGAWGSAQGIAGSGPMPPAPQGGVVGTVGDYGPSDYSGGAGFPAGGGSAPNPYRDPSYDRPDNEDRGYDDQDDDRGRMSGVL